MHLLSTILHSDLGTLVIKFFNSNFFVAIVGFGIFLLYKIQLNDNQRDAAKSIFFEVKNAEKSLKLIKESLSMDPPVLLENIYTMQVESWSRYKYLFIKSFDRDEWDAINDFYNRCQLIDRAVKYNEAFFQKNEEQNSNSRFIGPTKESVSVWMSELFVIVSLAKVAWNSRKQRG